MNAYMETRRTGGHEYRAVWNVTADWGYVVYEEKWPVESCHTTDTCSKMEILGYCAAFVWWDKPTRLSVMVFI